MLAYSLINSNANYTKRIEKITQAINELKTLKRNLKDDELESFKIEYNKIVDNIEFRSDIDFFNTVKSLCKEHNINYLKKPCKIDTFGNPDREKIKNYLSELSSKILQLKIIANTGLKSSLVLLPVIVIIICIIF